MAKYYAKSLQLPRTSIKLVHKGSGYADFAKLISAGGVPLKQYKVIVLMIGQADVLDRSVLVGTQLDKVRVALNRVNPALLLLVCTPMPWPGDTHDVAHKLHRTTGMLKALCHGKPTMEFSRVTEDLVTLEGVHEAFVDGQGLTLAGQELISRLVLGKIACGKMRDKYEDLRDSLRAVGRLVCPVGLAVE